MGAQAYRRCPGTEQAATGATYTCADEFHHAILQIVLKAGGVPSLGTGHGTECSGGTLAGA